MRPVASFDFFPKGECARKFDTSSKKNFENGIVKPQ
jgi:hypothetical protein